MKMNHLIPKLRFHNKMNEEFPEWENRTFGDIFDFYSTNSFSRDMLNSENGEIQNIHYGDIHTKFSTILDANKTNIPFLNDIPQNLKDDCFCKDGDLIIADASEDYDDIGKSIEIVNIGCKKIVAGLHTILARDNKGYTAIGYRGYMMKSPSVHTQVKVFAAGAKVLGISKTNLASVRIPLPSLPEQQKIADFLSTFDQRIGVQEDKIKVLEEIKKGLMQKIFSREIRFRDEYEEVFPEWEDKKVGEILKVKHGRNQKKVETENGPYPIYGTGGEIGRANTPIFTKPSVMIGRKGTINKPRYSNEPFWTVDTLFYTEIFDNYEPKFVYYLFCTIDWLRHNEASGVPSLSASNIEKIDVVVPNLPEQQKIADFLSTMDAKIDVEKEILERLKEIKKGLLQQMFV